MEAVQKDSWYFVVLIFLHFLKVAVQQKEVDVVRLEEGMVLSCLCPWDGKLTMVSWTKVPDNNPMAVLHPDLGESFSHLYQDRLEFLRLSQMDGSISLRNVTHQDIGEYHCSIQTFPRGPWTRNIQVEDLDEAPEEENITEPVPTEVTVADTVLVAEQSNNMTIRCNHQPNSTVYQVIFERMMLGHHWAIIGVCKTVEGGLVGEDYSDRGRVDCADSLDVTLHLTDVVPEDSGFYRCTFNTDVGVQTTTIQLTVAVSGGFSLSLYMMYIYIGAGAAGLFLLTAVLILVMRHRKKNKRKEYRVKLHPSQRQPNLYENIPLYPQIAKNSRQSKNCPIYANLQAGRSLQTTRRPRDKRTCML
ncbi:CD226 antigen isoform X4 [Kryptolebias marmoratus]|uniref:CD226 antigen isoform X4 n=1 Tax=Kryptolebias marmoratus TaxID=37003 RepID=UPI0007F87B19|nr:CD226 antigen isoform X4 [Kryptolebias marmoratus]